MPHVDAQDRPATSAVEAVEFAAECGCDSPTLGAKQKRAYYHC